jgi:hypothetical protein
MKKDWSHLEKYRVDGPAKATFGAFAIPQESGQTLYVIADDGTLTAWEHVSMHVRVKHRSKQTQQTPTWAQMCLLKSLFFDAYEVVMQLHPAEANHINIHPHVLHLWRPKNDVIPMPPKILV